MALRANAVSPEIWYMRALASGFPSRAASRSFLNRSRLACMRSKSSRLVSLLNRRRGWSRRTSTLSHTIVGTGTLPPGLARGLSAGRTTARASEGGVAASSPAPHSASAAPVATTAFLRPDIISAPKTA